MGCPLLFSGTFKFFLSPPARMAIWTKGGEWTMGANVYRRRFFPFLNATLQYQVTFLTYVLYSFLRRDLGGAQRWALAFIRLFFSSSVVYLHLLL